MLEFVLGHTAGQHTASRAASRARSAAVGDATIHTHRIKDLNERIDSLAIIIRAMRALIEEQGLTSDQLMAKIQELDMMDGTDDGRIGRSPTVCPECDSKVAAGLAPHVNSVGHRSWSRTTTLWKASRSTAAKPGRPWLRL